MRSNDSVSLMSDYDLDFHAWTQLQGALLRRLAGGERVNDADLDWPNIAEEIETLGRSERGAVAGCIRNIIQHLMKLEASSAKDPRPGWRATVRRERIDLEALLDDNTSLRPAVDGLIARELPRARRLAIASLEEYRETPVADPQRLTYTQEQVVGDWFPNEPE
jgi:uncharacterized protein DUF29